MDSIQCSETEESAGGSGRRSSGGVCGSKKLTLEDLEVAETPLGSGKIGRTYFATEKSTGAAVAVKIMEQCEVERRGQFGLVEQEIGIQSLVRHQNILQMHTFFVDEQFAYMVYEYAPGGNLQNFMLKQKNGRLSSVQTSKFVSQVADALNFCHEVDVIHRDINPGNLLLTSSGDIKIAEFGLCSLGSKQEMQSTTKRYNAPEIIQNLCYDHHVDSWALGILCYNLLVGDTPFDGESDEDLLKQVLSLDYAVPAFVPSTASDLISKLLKINPEARLSLPAVQKHICIVKGLGALKRIRQEKKRKQEEKDTKMSKTSWNLDNFEVGYTLGRGRFGLVYIAKEKKSKLMCAIKVIFKTEIHKHRMQTSLRREIEIHTKLKHPNILNMYTLFYDKRRLFLVFEYAAGGKLTALIQKQPNHRFKNVQASRYISQIADALHYCHENGVMHRDIKLENLLLGPEDDIKISDFGVSVHSPELRENTLCGNLQNLAPEMVKGLEYDHRVDIWALGVLCYYLLVGKHPFAGPVNGYLYERILKEEIDFPSYVVRSAKDIINKLMKKRPHERLALPSVQKHLWIVKNKAIYCMKK